MSQIIVEVNTYQTRQCGVLVGGSVPACEAQAEHEVVEALEVGGVSPYLYTVLWVEVESLGRESYYQIHRVPTLDT